MITAKEFLEKIRTVLQPSWTITGYFKQFYEVETTYAAYLSYDEWCKVPVSEEVAKEIKNLTEAYNTKMDDIAASLGLKSDSEVEPICIRESFKLPSVKDDPVLDVPVTDFIKSLGLTLDYIKPCSGVFNVLKPYLKKTKTEKTVKVTEYSL